MLIQLERIVLKSETDRYLLDHITTSFSSEEFVVVLGKNGAGKSLLLRSIFGLENPDGGAIHCIDTADAPKASQKSSSVAKRQQALGLVLQEAEKQVLCNIVQDDLYISLEMHGVAASEYDAKIASLCSVIPIAHLLHRNVITLSGGERRLVAIATVIVCEPRILFLDEPFQSLDYPACRDLLKTLLHIHHSGVGIVVVTHAYHSLLAHAHRALLLESGALRFDDAAEKVLPHCASYGLEPPHLPYAHMSILSRKSDDMSIVE